jgi:fatty aldehyde-generating acyl-ACP reductase
VTSVDVALLGHLESAEAYVQMMTTLSRTRRDADASAVSRLLPHLAPSPVCDVRVHSSNGRSIVARYIDLYLVVDATFEVLQARSKLARALEEAALSGARIAGLGGFSSIVGEASRNLVPRDARLALTTGNTLTAAALVEQVCRHVSAPGPITVVGAAGDVGSGSCRGLHARGYQLRLVGRSAKPLRELAAELPDAECATWPEAGVGAACIVLVASAALGAISLESISTDVLVIDAGHPRNGDRYPGMARGGRVRYAVRPEPEVAMLLERPDESHACLAEACILALESRLVDYSLGRGRITLETMQDMLAMASTHGVTPAPLHLGF